MPARATTDPKKWPEVYRATAVAALREAQKQVTAALKEPDPVFHINNALGALLRAKSNMQGAITLKEYQDALAKQKVK